MIGRIGVDKRKESEGKRDEDLQRGGEEIEGWELYGEVDDLIK